MQGLPADQWTGSAVQIVSQNRASAMRKLNAELVRSARDRCGLNQQHGYVVATGEDPVSCQRIDGILFVFADDTPFDHALVFARHKGLEETFLGRKASGSASQDGQVCFVDRSCFHLSGEQRSTILVFGCQDDSAGVSVQSGCGPKNERDTGVFLHIRNGIGQ